MYQVPFAFWCVTFVGSRLHFTGSGQQSFDKALASWRGVLRGWLLGLTRAVWRLLSVATHRF